MSAGNRESKVGRQIHMPIGRAFRISLKSIKSRLGRSVITSLGVFLGIAFLVSVLAQGLVQWPLPAKNIQPGFVRLDGEFTLPGDYPIRTTGRRDGAFTLADALGAAKGLTPSADKSSIMIVNTGGRKILVDLSGDGQMVKWSNGRRGRASDHSTIRPSETRMISGDVVMVPDAASGNRRIWLVVMSLLVCTIGITNAMLMAVTERFREIGTMKCLGALNTFVVELFLFESGMLGVVASAAGSLVGLASIILVAAVGKGWAVIGQVGGLDVLRLFGIGIGVGCFITIIATIAPAIKAAQMPPAAALRVEV